MSLQKGANLGEGVLVLAVRVAGLVSLASLANNCLPTISFLKLPNETKLEFSTF